ncbi:iron-containing alcohol dehydrogenase [Poseidonocella sp. HB161398]|uniref:iron-containing alcohol dehydrogenase n=1 Tax=Poseidonocella sp. HB161398 TaxID=2320855 RepID=UPI001108944F|nr:iron-containing alcohol dehydrogenase [Poseidonocella sp. HB161398]
MQSAHATVRPLRPAGGWTSDIDAVNEGRWRHPATGETQGRCPFEIIAIEDSLDGAEADLVARLGFGGAICVVSDTATRDAMGGRVARALGAAGEVVLEHPHADEAEIARLEPLLRGYDHVIAVGSGTVNDLCKYITARDGRRYAVFGTAASMDGYGSVTASITLESGLKVSTPAHAASGIFIDLAVNAAAPAHLAAAGFGDSVNRAVAQVDWWMSHRLRDTFYTDVAYLVSGDNEDRMIEASPGLPAGDIVSMGWLHRNLMFSGLGVSYTRVSNHGSMSEHQISHYIDCFAGTRHPGTLHGAQVGAASVAMARLQAAMLGSETPPQVAATRIDEDGMRRRMGAAAPQCIAEYRRKAFDAQGAAAFNERIAAIWPELRRECLGFMIPPAELEAMLRAAGAPVSGAELGCPPDLWREALRHGHEMRDRFSFVDIACDAGLLDDFVAGQD